MAADGRSRHSWSQAILDDRPTKLRLDGNTCEKSAANPFTNRKSQSGGDSRTISNSQEKKVHCIF